LYAKSYIAKGSIFTLENAGSFRPSHHEPALVFDQILGRHSRVNINPGDPIYSDFVI
jgi:sialic acid synthase SpsE